MTSRSLFAGLILAAVISSAIAAAVDGQLRQFIGSDLTGEFELFVKQGSCPKKILHKEFSAGPQGTYFIPHKKIVQNGVRCSDDGILSIATKARIEDLGGLDKLLETKQIAPIVQELKKQGSSFLVGSEKDKRTCGGTSISAESIFLFVEENKKIEVPGLINLFPGAKYMIVYEPNSPVPCTYFSKSSDRPIGAPAPSPKPINAKPAPPGVTAPPLPIGSSTGSSSESGSGKDTGNDADRGTDKGSQNGSDSGAEGLSNNDGAGSSSSFEDSGAFKEPEESNESDGSSTCFPSDAFVTLPGGLTKRMDAIELGDRVQVAPGLFSEVFMFTHRNADTIVNFIDITTASGAKLQLTPGHYMYVNGRLAAASTVREGDIVDLANGDASSVVGVHTVTKTGIYNPQTVHGDIVVNGIVTSTYTTTVDPNAAHSLLAPVRALFRSLGLSTAAFDSGSETLASVAPKGAAVC